MPAPALSERDLTVLRSFASRIDPSDAGAHNNLGVALVKQDRINDALAQYAEAVRLNPEYVDARNNLGATLAKLGRNDEAIAQFMLGGQL